MKKLMMIFGAIVLASFIFTSCGSKSKKVEDIKMDEITDVCDCIETNIILMEELIEIYDGIDDIKQLDDAQKAKLETIYEIVEELRVKCIEIEGGEEGCEGYDEMMSLRVEYNQIAPRSKTVKAADIKADELKDNCDCVEASLVFIKEMLAVYRSVEDINEMDEPKVEEINKLNEMWEEISEKCEEIAEEAGDEEEMEDCEKYEELIKTQEELHTLTETE